VTWQEAWGRIVEGERFEDPETLRLADSFGWSVAHLQARRGWTTLDPNILSLADKYGDTVLDRMMGEGWEPKTEEEKLIVFTVKAGS
jgi:hypothetical protein